MARSDRPMTQQRYSRILRREQIPAYRKTAEDHWLFRTLNLPERAGVEYPLTAMSSAIYYQNAEGDLEECPVSKGCVEEGVRSWVRNNEQPKDPSKFVGTVIVAPMGQAFMMAQTTLLHTNPHCRGKFDLFGGVPYVDEKPRSAACRELASELIAPLFFKSDACTLMEVIASQVVSNIQSPGTHTLTAFAVFLKDWEHWNQLFIELSKNHLTESSLAIVTRDSFEQILLPQEKQSPGRHFISSHHRVIQAILKAFDTVSSK